MLLQFDHLVIAARTLEEGAEWVEARLGAPMSAGGRHDVMGTHNRLLGLGPGRFLEVIAIDPAAPPPKRARWFNLDGPDMHERLRSGPKLIHWVARSDDIAAAVRATAGGRPEILKLSRGDFRWRIGVPRTGSIAQGGTSPTVIQWEGAHPSEALPDSGCRLERVVLGHPEAPNLLHALRMAGLDPEDPIEADGTRAGIGAWLRTPKGIAEIWSPGP